MSEFTAWLQENRIEVVFSVLALLIAFLAMWFALDDDDDEISELKRSLSSIKERMDWYSINLQEPMRYGGKRLFSDYERNVMEAGINTNTERKIVVKIEAHEQADAIRRNEIVQQLEAKNAEIRAYVEHQLRLEEEAAVESAIEEQALRADAI